MQVAPEAPLSGASAVRPGRRPPGVACGEEHHGPLTGEDDPWFPGRERRVVPVELYTLCVECPIRPECLQHAVDSGSSGYSGATSRNRKDLIAAGTVSVDAVDRLRARILRSPAKPLHASGQGSLAWYRNGCHCTECRAANDAKSQRDRGKNRRDTKSL